MTESSRKYTDEEIRRAYNLTESVWKAAEIVGCSGQTIQRRLIAMGEPRVGIPHFTEQEQVAIRAFYALHKESSADEMDLDSFASQLGRAKHSIAAYAGKRGWTRRNRTQSQKAKDNLSKARIAWHENNEHPRGMLGKKQSAERRAQMRKNLKNWQETATEEQKTEAYRKNQATRRANGGVGFPNVAGGGGYSKVKRGARADLGFFCRSAWEANWARYLNFLVSLKNHPLVRWEFEPDRFWFEPIRSGVTSYLPDFKLFEENREPYYHEVKGRMDQKSKTRMARMAKYYPDIEVQIIGSKEYRAVEKQVSAMIPMWEFG